jgi:hypothetical protein
MSTESARPRRDFILAYLFWLAVLIVVCVAIWLSSSALSSFRYAGF